MERHGWRAIIYDAPWARFKSGQTGVIVSEDGLSCETTDDDKSSIIVEAIPNTTFEDKGIGHILFRQKGSDLFDIVCLYQKAGGTYLLSVEPMTIDGCVGKDYGTFVRDLVIYEVINGERKQITDYNEKKSIIVKPTAIDASNNFKNDTDSIIEMPIIISSNGIEATSTLKITTAGDVISNYSGTSISDLNKISVTYNGGGSTYSSIYISGGNKNGACSGGTLTISTNEGTSTYPTYVISARDVTVSNIYEKIKCGTIIGTETEAGSVVEIHIVSSSGVREENSSGDSVTVSIANGVTEVYVIITTDKGKTEQIRVQIPQ